MTSGLLKLLCPLRLTKGEIMAVSKAFKLHEELLKNFEDFKRVLLKTSGQNIDDSKLIRFFIYKGLDEFTRKGSAAYPLEFWKNPVNYIKLQDSIQRMKAFDYDTPDEDLKKYHQETDRIIQELNAE